MSTRQYLIDTHTKHKIFLLRKAGGMYKQMLPFLKQLQEELEEIIKNSPTVYSRERYKQIFLDIAALHQTIISKMGKAILKQAKALSAYEAQFAKGLAEKAVVADFNSPNLNQIYSAVFTSVLDRQVIGEGGFNPKISKKGSKTVQDLLEDFGQAKSVKAIQIIRNGFVLGKVTSDIVTDLRQQTVSLNRRQAKTLAVTITNHVASQSHKAFYQENLDIIKGFQVVATLDDATTLTCGALDGKVFPVDEFEEPPYHWNCRTTYIPVFDDELNKSNIDGTRPAQKENGEYERVNTKTTYNSWLKSQSADFQDEILGPARGKLFRGGLSVDKFVDENFSPITLDELKAKDQQFN
jgi:SPP1 gp7 family putative phage head morphogenesis protein